MTVSSKSTSVLGGAKNWKSGSNARVKLRELRVMSLLVIPLLLLASVVGLVQPSLTRASTAGASSSFSPNLDPPSNLQIITLDSTFHVNWTPSTDAGTMWHVVSVWDGNTLQQSKVGGRTTSVMQTNGLIPGRTYTVKVQAMDANWQLSAPVQAVATTDPQSPMRNAAFFENFNGNGATHGPLDPNYFDVRSQGIAFEDITENRAAFNNENHWHSLLIGSGIIGGVFARPRVPFDFEGRTGTLQFEVDNSPVQHSHGKWWSTHLVQNIPSLPSDMGNSRGDDWPNSIEFGTYEQGSQHNTESFNKPFIAVNINGNIQRFEADHGIMTAGNIRLPVVIKVSQTSAEMFINGISVVRATGFTLPFTRGHWLFGQNNYGSGKVDWIGNPPTILQLIHWETLQFDGPQGSYNPVVRTFIQPGCDGSVDDGHNVIVGCPAFVRSGQLTNSFNFNISDANVANARSARLLFYGRSSQSLAVYVNGNRGYATVATDGGLYEKLNTFDFPTSWLRQGSNELRVETTDQSLTGLAQFEVEVVFNEQRVLTTPSSAPHQLISLTSSNYRVEHVPGNPNIHTVSTYVYSLGTSGSVPFDVQIVKGGSWLQVTPSTGILQAVALGGGMTRLDIQVDFATISDQEDAVIKVNGGVMPAYIGVYAVRENEPSEFTPIDTAYFTNTFNKSAIPDYHGPGGAGTPSPTFIVQPSPTPGSPSSPTPVPSSPTPGGPSATPRPPTSTPVPTNPPAPTNTPWPNLCTITFTDVPRDHWAWNYITYMACHEIVSGYSDGTFRPNNSVSRGQIAKIVSNSAGFNEDPGAQIYEDVPLGHTFYAWINRLTHREIMSGYSCGSAPGEACQPGNMPYFRPGAVTTRGQITKIVSNAAGFNDDPGAQVFEDVPPDHTFYVWVQRLASRGIMSGYPCGTVPNATCVPPMNRPYFMPANNATRAQVSKIVSNALITP